MMKIMNGIVTLITILLVSVSVVTALAGSPVDTDILEAPLAGDTPGAGANTGDLSPDEPLLELTAPGGDSFDPDEDLLVSGSSPDGGTADAVTQQPEEISPPEEDVTGEAGTPADNPEPEVTVTSTVTAEPTPTVTAEPTPTATAEPTPTATAEPTPTATAEPTPTAT
ncbi:MAG: hypothetical protein M0P17_12080, partial [Methanoculleus sp.]|nr:hypothetical protein [Methanoculleus sp.]